MFFFDADDDNDALGVADAIAGFVEDGYSKSDRIEAKVGEPSLEVCISMAHNDDIKEHGTCAECGSDKPI